MRWGVLLVLLLLTAPLAGCLEGDSLPEEDANSVQPYGSRPFPACEHPWPCADGSEWPTDLEGPFDVLDPVPLRIPGHDGVELEAYLWKPGVPQGVELPVVVRAEPYAGQCSLTGGSCAAPGDDPSRLASARLQLLVEAGYAVVNVNVRGTGTSGGCFGFTGPNEARDLARAVEWLANQPWSNGRVAMTGISYMGTTPWMAANLNPPTLKTIVPGAIWSNLYTYAHTPQGAADPDFPLWTLFPAERSVLPPAGAPENLPAWAQVARERACPELATMLETFGTDHHRDDRHEAFWEARRHVGGFPNITAAVFAYHGFRDDGHGFMEDAIWSTLENAPKRMLLGEWGHKTPDARDLNTYPGGSDWSQVIVPWLDFWLKGIGDAPPRLGVVDYQTRQGAWHEARAWPPEDRREEALYLAHGELRGQPAEASTTFRATKVPASEEAYCEPGSTAAVFVSDPVDAPLTLAGNPYAYLQVRSDQPGGIVAVDLYYLGPEARCEGPDLVGGDWLVGGAADLRFHEGDYEGRDFPTGETTPVRVDLMNIAYTLKAGHRVAVVATGPGDGNGNNMYTGQPYTPTITLHGDGSAAGSHIVLPIVNGTLGGGPAGVDYPPRPFVPGGSDAGVGT